MFWHFHILSPNFVRFLMAMLYLDDGLAVVIEKVVYHDSTNTLWI